MTDDDEREADIYRLEPRGVRWWIDQARRALTGDSAAPNEALDPPSVEGETQ